MGEIVRATASPVTTLSGRTEPTVPPAAPLREQDYAVPLPPHPLSLRENAPLVAGLRGETLPVRAARVLPAQAGDPWNGLLNDPLGIDIDSWARRETPTLKAYFPPQYARTVASHVQYMFDQGWADQLDRTGLFHGHLLLGRDLPESFDSPTAMLDHTELCLYHTAEFTGRWAEQADLPVESRTPRSILGRRDGTAFPAIELLPPGHSSVAYDQFGTISSGPLESEYPERFFDTQNLQEPRLTSNGHAWSVATQFYIRPDRNGRFF
ncbi:MAG: hypothetical protein AAFY60_05730, partial [Myxococcota bacterium]